MFKKSKRKATKPLTPFWATADDVTVRLYQGDVLETLKRMPSRSVQCVVTSPPYWALRSYLEDGHEDKHRELGSEELHDCHAWARGENCAEVDWEKGCHVCRMVLVFREVRRVLRDDGTLWLDYGDTYGNGKSGGGVFEQGRTDGRSGDGGKERWKVGHQEKIKTSTGLPPGNLAGVPWRVALALQADGWVLRQDIVIAKKSPMPESVKNRCTKSHEMIFLLCKRTSSYYYDAEAIRDPSGANKRSVWLVSNQGYEGAHYATFSTGMIEPCVLAGTSEKGCCAECGAPWRRVVEGTAYTPEVVPAGVRNVDESRGDKTRKLSGQDYNKQVKRSTVGWEPTCECQGKIVKRKVRKVVKRRADDEDAYDRDHTQGNRNGKGSVNLDPEVEVVEKELETTETVYESDVPLEDHEVVPCVVMDPFMGSGTTAVVALMHGRRAVGIDLSKKYLRDNAVPRIEGYLGSVPKLARLTGKKPKKLLLGKSV